MYCVVYVGCTYVFDVFQKIWYTLMHEMFSIYKKYMPKNLC